MSLDWEKFSEFFFALHGYQPFRWQQRLAQRVSQEGWPDALELPTASGKTTCIDIAVFALAVQADWPAERRTAPRRIFFVVDRRIVVDEAFDRARLIAEKLEQANDGLLRIVADRLRLLTNDPEARPLAHAVLRGGMVRDEAWADSPVQPVVLCSTVDQVGSRILFRGYGLGPASTVIHAGLTGNDSLIVLDEAHCAEPFRQTLSAVDRYRSWNSIGGAPASPFKFVIMSATPPAGLPSTAIFPDRDDWRSDLAQPDQDVLRRRIAASKPAELAVAPRESAKSCDKLAKTLVERAKKLVNGERRRIAVIVNRVATARRVHQLLQQNYPETALLLTGRMRPLDRDELLSEWQPNRTEINSSKSTAGAPERRGLLAWCQADPRSLDGPNPAAELSSPLFIVATQCLEVGANLDFDGMVSECASLDALRQRFGRLNRLGRTIEARGAVVIRDDQIEPKSDDPIYGAALPDTWKWLKTHAVDSAVDFGIAAIDAILPERDAPQRTALQRRPPDAPVLLPAHLDAWVQTSPPPAADPLPALFLHGVSDDRAEVNVCWRRDLLGPAETQDGEINSDWLQSLSLCAPASGECVAVPLWLVRQWLAGQETTDADGDIESGMGEEFSNAPSTGEKSKRDQDDERSSVTRLVVVWRGPDESFVATGEPESARKIRPGDTLVFPVPPQVKRDERTTREEPRERESWELLAHLDAMPGRPPCLDRGDEANFKSRSRAVLRLHPSLLLDDRVWPQGSVASKLVKLLSGDDREDRVDEIIAILRAVPEEQELGPKLQSLIEQLVAKKPRAYWYYADGTVDRLPSGARQEPGLILVQAKPATRFDTSNFAGDDDRSLTTSEIGLHEHSLGVAERAATFARLCGLESPQVDDYRFAGMGHDLGKLDERFQTWLRGGDEVARRLTRRRPLAKSAGNVSAAEREMARRRSGYPRGGRHELLSVRIVEQLSWLDDCRDPDLVLHLIAAHHGRCRPLAPIVRDDANQLTASGELYGEHFEVSVQHRLERIDSGVSDRFWRLVRRYGWWGLAWYEAIFMLADHRQSWSEQLPAAKDASNDKGDGTTTTLSGSPSSSAAAVSNVSMLAPANDASSSTGVQS